MATMSGTNHNADAPRRFGTILVARPQTQRPSELEVLLREHSHKMRVLSSSAKLSGAHMVFEKGVALRIYYPNDIARLDQDNEGTDGVFEFCMAFQWPVVFFVAPNASETLQSGSFVDRVMTKALVDDVPAEKAPPRLFVLSNTTQVMNAFFTFADDVTNVERRAKRSQVMLSLQNAASDQGCVASAIRGLLAPPRCPMGEADVVLCHFGNLLDIINCSEDQLDQLPIERRTKLILREFFCGAFDNPNWCPDNIDEEHAGYNNSPTSVIQSSHQFQEHQQCINDGPNYWQEAAEDPAANVTTPHYGWSHAPQSIMPPMYAHVDPRNQRMGERSMHPAMMSNRQKDPRMVRNRASERPYY